MICVCSVVLKHTHLTMKIPTVVYKPHQLISNQHALPQPTDSSRCALSTPRAHLHSPRLPRRYQRTGAHPPADDSTRAGRSVRARARRGMHSRHALGSVRRRGHVQHQGGGDLAGGGYGHAGDMICVGSVEEALEYQATWASSTLVSMGVSSRWKNSTMIID
jgi:hypothetical protein